MASPVVPRPLDRRCRLAADADAGRHASRARLRIGSGNTWRDCRDAPDGVRRLDRGRLDASAVPGILVANWRRPVTAGDDRHCRRRRGFGHASRYAPAEAQRIRHWFRDCPFPRHLLEPNRHPAEPASDGHGYRLAALPAGGHDLADQSSPRHKAGAESKILAHRRAAFFVRCRRHQ